MKNKILFISHDANTTGATIYLLSLIESFYRNNTFSVSVLFLSSGPLVTSFQKFGDIFFWNNPKTGLLNKACNNIFSVTPYQKRIINKLKKNNFKLIYGNTISSSSVFSIFTASLKIPIVWHIHELSLVTKLMGIDIFQKAEFVHYIIANSKHTKDYLIKDHNISKNKITVHYPFIDRDKIDTLSKITINQESPTIPADAFIIGSSGSAILAKGIDVFLKLPIIIDYFYPENTFFYVWTGKVSSKNIIEYDLEKSNLKDKVFFVGAHVNPYPIYKSYDIFLSCSREESFGLSAIECASLGKPLVCFKNTGGIAEIVEKSGNISVPYLDIIEMAKSLISISKSDSLLKKMGADAKNYSAKFDADEVIEKMANFILKIIKESK